MILNFVRIILTIHWTMWEEIYLKGQMRMICDLKYNLHALRIKYARDFSISSSGSSILSSKFVPNLLYYLYTYLPTHKKKPPPRQCNAVNIIWLWIVESDSEICLKHQQKCKQCLIISGFLCMFIWILDMEKFKNLQTMFV